MEPLMAETPCPLTNAEDDIHQKPIMVKQQANNMSEAENDGIRILGFTDHEVELILMSIQCIKGSKRFTVGWEVGMKDFANLTNTSIPDARAQWKDLSSRLMKLPRLPSKSPSPEPSDDADERIEECIIVREEMDDESSSDAAEESDEEDERESKRKTRTGRKGKQVAKPSVLDSLEAEVDSEDNVGAPSEGRWKSNDDVVLESPANEDRTEQAWAEIGDGMTEEKWNEMGDRLAM